MPRPPPEGIIQLLQVWPLVSGRNPVRAGLRILRPRGLPGWSLWVTESGVARVRHTSGSFLSAPGSVVLCPPGVAHDYGPEGVEWHSRWVVFQPRAHWLPTLQAACAGSWRCCDGADAVAIVTLLDDIANILAGRTPTPDPAAWAMWKLEGVVLALRQRQSTDALVARAEAVLAEHLERPLRLDGLARELGLSAPQVVRRFRAVHGLSPMAWRQARRLDEACRLLFQGVDGDEAARRTGWGQARTLARAMRRQVGHGIPSAMP